MITVLVFGTFDVIHPGHRYFLEQAGQLGDRLIAVIARDKFVEKAKNRKPVHNEKERISHILNSGLVDEAFLADEVTGTYEIVERTSPQVVCFGHDQDMLAESFRQWLTIKDLKIEIETIAPFKRDQYSSTLRNKRHY